MLDENIGLRVTHWLRPRSYLGDFLAAGLGDDLAAGLGDDLAAVLAAGVAFTSADAPGDATGDGDGDGVAVGDGTGTVADCSAEFEPLIPGNDNANAINMKVIAAPIVIFARMFCVPLGPKAVLETLLVNRAPASAFPGCNNTTTINTRQDRINRVYKM